LTEHEQIVLQLKKQIISKKEFCKLYLKNYFYLKDQVCKSSSLTVKQFAFSLSVISPTASYVFKRYTERRWNSCNYIFDNSVI